MPNLCPNLPLRKWQCTLKVLEETFVPTCPDAHPKELQQLQDVKEFYFLPSHYPGFKKFSYTGSSDLMPMTTHPFIRSDSWHNLEWQSILVLWCNYATTILSAPKINAGEPPSKQKIPSVNTRRSQRNQLCPDPHKIKMSATQETM